MEGCRDAGGREGRGQTNRQTGRKADREGGGQKDKRAGRQEGRQTDRQTGGGERWELLECSERIDFLSSVWNTR